MTLDEFLKKIEMELRSSGRTDYFEFCALMPKQTEQLYNVINGYSINHERWIDCLANINISINCLNAYATFTVFEKNEVAQQRSHKKGCKKSFSSLIRLFKVDLKEMNCEHLLRAEIR